MARVSGSGALAASIAHEMNQPLAGIITNAVRASGCWAPIRPNVDGARETARRTIRDGNRASDVITRLRRSLRRRARRRSGGSERSRREVVALSVSELQRSGIVLRQDFADELPRPPAIACSFNRSF